MTTRRWRDWCWDRGSLRRLGYWLVALAVAGGLGGCVMISMPGHNYRGPLPALTADETALAAMLRTDLATLAGTIGERNWRQPAKLKEAADFLTRELTATGYTVRRLPYRDGDGEYENLEAELPGTAAPGEIVVVGGHYDSVEGTPGANDNGSGAVATLALARRFAGKPAGRTLRFVMFVNEEPPFFQRETQGSLVYAKACQARGDRIVGMLSLETLGYFRDEPGTQQYPEVVRWFYPDTGNFIAFVGNVQSRRLVRTSIASFRRHTLFPSEGIATFGFIEGIDWSDHASFWQCGYPGLMVTDTAVFRYPHYHQPTDTPDQVDYDRLARVVAGIERVLRELAEPTTKL